MRLLLIGLLLLASCAAGAATPQSKLTPDQRARYQTLVSQFRCVVCMNRSIDDSDAPLAADLRNIVARQVAAGRSDTQIKHYLVARYGQFVLYKPRFEPATWLLWLGPAVLLFCGLAVVLWILRRARSVPEPGAPDPDAVARLLDED